MATLKYWLWLTGRRGLGNAGALRVLDHFVTPERAFYADPEEYALVEDLTPAAQRALLDKDTGGAERILEDCARLDLRIMTLQDADYPERLRAGLPLRWAPGPTRPRGRPSGWPSCGRPS